MKKFLCRAYRDIPEMVSTVVEASNQEEAEELFEKLIDNNELKWDTYTYPNDEDGSEIDLIIEEENDDEI